MQNIQEVLHLLLEELLAEGDVDPEGGRDGVGRTPCDRQPVNLIDDSRLRSLTARQLVAALQRDGFIPARQRGSHHRYEHPDGRMVTVPFPSPGDPFLLKTLKSIIEKQARWTEEDLQQLDLL